MRIRNCRSCGSDQLASVIDLGDQYLSDFRDDDKKPKKYPLEMIKCETCHFCQLSHSAPLDEMYTENYGFKSGVNEAIKEDLRSIALQARSYIPKKKPSVLDIGCNDGEAFYNYMPGSFRVGVDPIAKLCKEAESKSELIINDFFSADVVRKNTDVVFDIITATSMFYDVEDPNKLIADMVSLLDDKGVIIIQQNYLLATLQNNAYDNICHEHIGYHSLLSMDYLFEKNGLVVVDVSTSMVNGGVLRTVVQKKGVGTPTYRVQKQRDIEKEYRLDTPSPYKRFRLDIIDTAFRLKKMIDGINAKGQKCYIYAASTRGGTIWQYVGLDVKDIPFAVDRNPGKVGKKIASVGIPIISEEQARRDKPEYMLMSIWFFAESCIEREKEYLANGGHFIIPLPELRIV